MREAKGAIFNTDAIAQVDPGFVDTLKARALAAPLGRFRFCLHHSTSEAVQQMIIANRRATYYRPHRHDVSELYVMIEGELLVLIFDDQGELSEKITLKGPGHDAPFCARLAPGCWHTLFTLSETAVSCEVLGAPNPDGGATEYANWAPDQDDPKAIKAFFDKLDLTTPLA